jgi:hypothetical protein
MSIRGGVRRGVVGLLVAVAVVACRGPESTPSPQTGGRPDTPTAPAPRVDIARHAAPSGIAAVRAVDTA